MSSSQRFNVSLWYTGVAAAIVGATFAALMSLPSIAALIPWDWRVYSVQVVSLVLVLTVLANTLFRYLLLSFFSPVARAPKRRMARAS